MSKPHLSDALLAIGSAHDGRPLTHDMMLKRLRDPAFSAKFNGPPPAEVTFPDEETAALGATFENAGRRS